MASTRFSGALLAVAALCSPVVLASTASAEPNSPSTLTLMVQPETGAASTVSLKCGPIGGSHPSPQQACDEIALADGDFNRLPKKTDQHCTMEYRPVTVSAVGRWKCENVRWTRKYGNSCQLHTDTGSVFAF